MHAGWMVVLLALPTIAEAAGVYRCRDASGSVLYADVPCASGAVVDIPASNADPRALERLQRAVERPYLRLR